MEFFNPVKFEHLQNAVLVKKLGSGGFGSIRLYQCKNKCFFNKCQELSNNSNDSNDSNDSSDINKSNESNECNIEEISNNKIDNTKSKQFHYCNKLFVIKKIKIYDCDVNYIKNISDYRHQIMYNEYNIGKILNHEYIIKTYDVDIDNYSVILEHCTGVDLFDYLNKPKYTNNRDMTKFANLYLQLLEAVCYLHENNIAHMDIKLENIMYNKITKKIKLIDFGQADYYKKDDKYVYCTTIKGTIEYLPPEVFCPTYYTGDAIDVWSCIIVLYNLIYNNTPWDSATKKNYQYMFTRDYYIRNSILHKDIFKNPCNYGYNSSDAQIIFKIFEILFKKHRDNIFDIKNQFSKLSLFNKNIN